MSSAPIDVTIGVPIKGRLTKRWVRELVSKTLEAALAEKDGEHRPFQVSVMVTDDETLRRLNRHYRGKDEVTDVLSFSPTHGGHWLGEDTKAPPNEQVEFILPPDEPQPLGEVIISYPQATRQAHAGSGKPHPVKEEMALLVVHGVLHLLGYDHADPKETTAMRAKEREVLDAML